jgi:hypothetical protein
MRLILNYKGIDGRARLLGIATFSFFLIKGLAWIAVPALVGSAVTSCDSGASAIGSAP